MKVFLTLILGLCAALCTVTTSPVESTGIDVFDQLDDYSLMGVFDFLHLNDLVILASVSPRSHQLIMDHYILPKIGVNETKLCVVHKRRSTPAVILSDVRGGSCSGPTDLTFQLDHIQSALKVLCPLASNLEITLRHNHGSNISSVDQVVSYVNRHCADVPQSVQIIGLSLEANFQFPHAKRVKILVSSQLEQYDVAKAFPSVEQLTILIQSNRFTLAQHLPNLTHFRLDDWDCGNFDLQAFGERNPQIRSAELEICGRIENIDAVNRLFPNLETLSLQLQRELNIEREREQLKIESVASTNSSTSMLPAPADLVRFRNVKKFTLDVSRFYGAIQKIGRFISFTPGRLIEDKLTAIVFDQLDSFGYFTDSSYENIADQVDYIARYKDVKSLDVRTIPLMYPELGRLADALPKLEEITFASIISDPTHLMRFLAETHLQTVTVKCSYYLMAIDIAARTILPEGWYLPVDEVIEDYTMVTFKR